jgi:AcrR family transcriptional regulator
MSEAATPGGPIRRGRRARERVMQAALAVLAERGLAGFTMDAVAQRAGASKATVYRHWPSQASLLVDAAETVSATFPLPETGHLRTDLIVLLERLEAVLESQPFPRLMAAFVDAAERDADLSRLSGRITEERRRPFRHVLSEAVRRGELPATTQIDLVVDLLTGPAFYRRFIAHWPIPENYASTVVDHVLRGLTTTSQHR